MILVSVKENKFFLKIPLYALLFGMPVKYGSQQKLGIPNLPRQKRDLHQSHY